ncbi:MAG: hypothetical protein LH650_11380 [Chloroflexi bacterium]|nr:hypothetical protein [Chloroflexota bacterium]
MKTFEQGFAETQRAAESTVKAASSLVTLGKQLQKAARLGDIAAVRRLADRLAAASDAARQEVSNARTAWPFTPDEEDAYLRDAYEDELLAAAAAVGLRIDRRDGALVSFPSIVRIVPQARAIKVDRRKSPALRPSIVVESLRANQTKKPAFATDRFLESMYRSYRLIVGRDGQGTVAPLSTVYESLTLLPGSAADYGPSDFARDLFLLDRSGVTQTKSGARVSLPASTGTKTARGVYTFVAPDGQVLTYYGIRFDGAL